MRKLYGQASYTSHISIYKIVLSLKKIHTIGLINIKVLKCAPFIDIVCVYLSASLITKGKDGVFVICVESVHVCCALRCNCTNERLVTCVNSLNWPDGCWLESIRRTRTLIIIIICVVKHYFSNKFYFWTKAARTKSCFCPKMYKDFLLFVYNFLHNDKWILTCEALTIFF